MFNRKLRRRSPSVDSRAPGALENAEDCNSTHFSQECRGIIEGSRDVEVSNSQLDFENTRKEPTITNKSPVETPENIDSNQFHDLITTVMLAIKSESTKVTSTIESLRSEIKKDHEKLIKNFTKLRRHKRNLGKTLEIS